VTGEPDPASPSSGCDAKALTSEPDGAASARLLVRTAVGTGALAVALLAGISLLGVSVAVPPVGPPSAAPPWQLGLHPSPWLVTVALWLAAALGTVAVGAGLRAVAVGARSRPRHVALAAGAAVAVLVAVPPLGSADHLSYAAYGRIAAQGADPYLTPPSSWRGGSDPVVSAVQPPWQDTPSVYGPVATGAMAAVSFVAGPSARRTVWLLQLLCGSAFLAVAWLLDRAVRANPEGRARAAVLWTLNPLLLGQLVLGAHVDVLAAAFAVAGLVAGARRPLVAGVLLGAAVSVKAPYALFGLALLWGVRAEPRRDLLRTVLLGLAGVLLVAVPAHLAAGPHVFDQLSVASRFVSIATPWRAISNAVDLLIAPGALRPLATPLALALGLALGVLVIRRRLLPAALAAARPGRVPPPVIAVATGLTAGWLLATPYALPWYAALAWPALVLAPATALDRGLLAQLAVLTVAYVPGRVVGLTPAVETVTLGLRRFVAPVLLAALIAAVVRWAWQGGRMPTAPAAAAAQRNPVG
jgi:hypothetical protein